MLDRVLAFGDEWIPNRMSDEDLATRVAQPLRRGRRGRAGDERIVCLGVVARELVAARPRGLAQGRNMRVLGKQQVSGFRTCVSGDMSLMSRDIGHTRLGGG